MYHKSLWYLHNLPLARVKALSEVLTDALHINTMENHNYLLGSIGLPARSSITTMFLTQGMSPYMLKPSCEWTVENSLPPHSDSVFLPFFFNEDFPKSKLWNLVKIVKFSQHFEIWLKFWNLVEILKFGQNFWIWIEILKFGQISQNFWFLLS